MKRRNAFLNRRTAFFLFLVLVVAHKATEPYQPRHAPEAAHVSEQLPPAKLADDGGDDEFNFTRRRLTPWWST